MTDLMALQQRIAPDFDRLTGVLLLLVQDGEESNARGATSDGGEEPDGAASDTVDRRGTLPRGGGNTIETRDAFSAERQAAGIDSDPASPAKELPDDHAVSGVATPPRGMGLSPLSKPADSDRLMASMPLRRTIARHAPLPLPLPATARTRLPGSRPTGHPAAPGHGIRAPVARTRPAATRLSTARQGTGALSSGQAAVATSMIDSVMTAWPPPELLGGPAWQNLEERDAEALPDPFADADLEQRLANILEDAARTAGIDW